jgi:hypothetical protein
MAICAVSYVVFSLLKPSTFDLKALLQRGERAGEHDQSIVKVRARGWHWIGINNHFSRSDTCLYLLTYAWSAIRILVFVGVTGFVLVHRVIEGEWFAFGGFWLKYWHSILWLRIVAAAALIVWLTTGGFFDLCRMIKRLRQDNRDAHDDGFVTPEE